MSEFIGCCMKTGHYFYLAVNIPSLLPSLVNLCSTFYLFSAVEKQIQASKMGGLVITLSDWAGARLSKRREKLPPVLHTGSLRGGQGRWQVNPGLFVPSLWLVVDNKSSYIERYGQEIIFLLPLFCVFRSRVRVSQFPLG